MEYLDFSKEMAIMDIKRNKNSVNTWRAVFILNIVGVIMNLLCAWHGGFVNAICAGALIGNLLWITSQFFSSKQDLKFDQERLNHLENLSEDNNYRGMMDQLKSTQEYYQKLVSNIVETNASVTEKT